jgi:hypothetical protein
MPTTRGSERAVETSNDSASVTARLSRRSGRLGHGCAGEIGQVCGVAHRSRRLMTITVGRLLVYVSGLLAAVIFFLGSSWFGPSRHQSFAREIQAICREKVPTIADASDPRTALTHSREMQSRLSTLTAPAAQQKVFSQWLADLHAATKAAAHGKWLRAEQYDGGAELDVRSLRVSQDCIVYFRHQR